MRSTLSAGKRLSLRLLLALFTAVASACSFVTSAHATIFNGAGVKITIANLRCLGGISCETDIRALIVKLLKAVLDFVTLLGVITVIIAGIYLITSNGDEGSKDKAKKIIFYTAAGILIIVFSRAIVTFFANLVNIP